MIRNLIITLLVLIATSPIQAFDLDSLLVHSIGGPNALQRIERMQSSYMTGSVDLNGLKGRFVQAYSAPDKFYLALEFDGFVLKQGYDGKTAWNLDMNGSITVLDGYEKSELLKSIYLESFSYLLNNRLPGSKKYIGEAEFEGSPCHLVNFYPFDTDTIIVYYEKSTGMKKGMKTSIDNLDAFVITDFSDTVENVILPSQSRSVAPEASLQILFVADTLEFNRTLMSSLFSASVDKPQDYYFPEKADSVVVPFQLKYGHIRVNVTVNGHKKLWFILDSGASSSIINSSITTELGLPKVGSIPAKGLAGYTEAALVETDSLAIGDLIFYGQVAGSLDLSKFDTPKTGRFGGLLGYDFISRFPMLIDYKNSQLVIYNNNQFDPPEGGIEIPFTLTMQVPTITGSINGFEGKFIIDLGNSFGLVLHHHFLQETNLAEELTYIEEKDKKIGGIGKLIPGKTALVDSLRFSEIILTDLPVIIPKQATGLSGSKELAGNIGNQVLNLFKVLFDYDKSRLVFYPVDN